MAFAWKCGRSPGNARSSGSYALRPNSPDVKPGGTFNKSERNMAQYVDGFVLPVPKKNLAAYRRMARKATKIWREYAALGYKECARGRLNANTWLPFARRITSTTRYSVVCVF